MAKVIFMHFNEKTDGIYDAKIGEPLTRVAKENGVPLPLECEDGQCGSCLLNVENIAGEEPTSYMEDMELDKLVELGAITTKEANTCQQFTISPKVRLACQMLVKGDILVKPYKG
ncbi:MAG: 2Fe-2S iron-sulfur cluster-binding protein [Campylobacterota bacterium]|nr:2Fe-2S iron-sulfur cluster-binding protein [Campylobacterota bacterium]